MGGGDLPAGNESRKALNMRNRMWASVGIRRKQQIL